MLSTNKNGTKRLLLGLCLGLPLSVSLGAAAHPGHVHKAPHKHRHPDAPLVVETTPASRSVAPPGTLRESPTARRSLVEHQKHMKRLAQLDRLEQIAAANKNRKLWKKVQRLRGQELKRHAAEVKTLRRTIDGGERRATWSPQGR